MRGCCWRVHTKRFCEGQSGKCSLNLTATNRAEKTPRIISRSRETFQRIFKWNPLRLIYFPRQNGASSLLGFAVCSVALVLKYQVFHCRLLYTHLSSESWDADHSVHRFRWCLLCCRRMSIAELSAAMPTQSDHLLSHIHPIYAQCAERTTNSRDTRSF